MNKSGMNNATWLASRCNGKLRWNPFSIDRFAIRPVSRQTSERLSQDWGANSAQMQRHDLNQAAQTSQPFAGT